MNTNSDLIRFSPRDRWTLLDAFEGVAVFGGNGSGKTSGSLYHIVLAMLRAGLGGLVLTVKPDEAQRIISYAVQVGRERDVLVVHPEGAYTLNFLDYEFQRAGGHATTQELVSVLMTAMSGGRQRGDSRDPYWDDAVTQLLTNTIDLVTLATGSLNLGDLVKVIRAAPRSPEDAASILWEQETLNAQPPEKRVWARTSYCAELLRQANSRNLSEEEHHDFRETKEFWLYEFSSLDGRTRSNIESSLMSRLTGLLRRPYWRLFCQKTTVTPEDSFEGRVIILDLPVKVHGESGRMAQVMFKTIWQRAAERRSGGAPVFLLADEAQYFVTRQDALFQQTARSSKVATVLATQSIVNYQACLDDASSSVAVADSLLGTLQTKVFHGNACPRTNEWAESLFGDDLQWMHGAQLGGEGIPQVSVQRGLYPVLPKGRFTQLRKGGLQNDGIVEGYIFQTGRRWQANQGKNWLLHEFKQATW